MDPQLTAKIAKRGDKVTPAAQKGLIQKVLQKMSR
jgi:hypothetical protein